MFGLVVLVSGIVTLVATGLDFVSTDASSWSRSNSGYGRSSSTINLNGRSKQVASTIIAGVISFGALIGVNWLIFYRGTPVFAGVGWFWLAFFNVLTVCVIFGITNLITHRWALAAPGLAIAMVLFSIFGLGAYNEWRLADDSNTFANVAKVTQDVDSKAYPPTDDNHMVVVSGQNALNKANQSLNQVIPGDKSNTTIGSRYSLGTCELQSVASHMYYICGLLLTDNTYNNQAVHNIVPGYIVVDAEDPNMPSQARLTYTMKYGPNGPGSSSLTRLIWNSYKSYYIDDITLEVNDQWQPFYTAAIDKPLYRWQQSVPVGAITVDPQTGDIQRYDLQHIPAWVDRVYSATMVKNMLKWWGDWKVVPWSTKGSGGRFQVDGDVTLVYTTNGPAWQALVTSQQNTNSVVYIALMDTRSTKITLYKAPDGLTAQATIVQDISTSKNNVSVPKLKPVGLALHEIYGELVWVAPLEPGDAVDGQPASFAGIAMLSATDPLAANVIIGTDKGDALGQLNNQITNGSTNPSAQATSTNAKVEGYIASAGTIVSNGKSFEVFKLNGDPTHVYLDEINPGVFDSLQAALAKPGDHVSLVYLDNAGKSVRGVKSYNTINPSK